MEQDKEQELCMEQEQEQGKNRTMTSSSTLTNLRSSELDVTQELRRRLTRTLRNFGSLEIQVTGCCTDGCRNNRLKTFTRATSCPWIGDPPYLNGYSRHSIVHSEKELNWL